MGIPFLSGQVSPIVVDFGHASLKFLQVTTGASPSIVAVAELPIPEEHRGDAVSRNRWVAERIPTILKSRPFKGRRVVFSPYASEMVVQHVQVNAAEGVEPFEQAKIQLQSRLGNAGDLVVRTRQVAEVPRDGQLRQEHLCVAIARDEVMRTVELFRRMRLQVVGVHDAVSSAVRAFDHLHRRDGDENRRTLYIDLGWSHTRVAIAHGTETVFGKSIPLGGRQFAGRTDVGELDADLASLLGGGLVERSNEAGFDPRVELVPTRSSMRRGATTATNPTRCIRPSHGCRRSAPPRRASPRSSRTDAPVALQQAWVRALMARRRSRPAKRSRASATSSRCASATTSRPSPRSRSSGRSSSAAKPAARISASRSPAC